MIKSLQLVLLLLAINVANNLNAQDYTKLKVTELHYHPLDSIYEDNDTVSGKNFEFIEFKNISYTESLDVSGVVVDSAINFEFPEYTVLAPQAYFVVAAKPSKFYDRYKEEANGNFSSSFSNGGEQVLVLAPDGSTIMDFTYYDEEPWPEEPDGDGNTLIPSEINPTGDPDDYLYWKTSRNIHGSPGYSDPVSTGINDLFGENSNGLVNLHPNPTNNELNIQWTQDNSEEYKVEIYSVNGALVYSEIFQTDAKIYLSDLSIDYGVYFLKVKTLKSVESQKLIYSQN